MTRIVLLLTAIPLAAVLAWVLNTVLERRLAAHQPSADGVRQPRLPRVLSTVLALALSLAAAQAQTKEPTPGTGERCASIDCSLIVEASRVDRLWARAPDSGVTLVAQSRIPVAFDADLDRRDAVSEDEVVADEELPQSRSAASGALPSTRP